MTSLRASIAAALALTLAVSARAQVDPNHRQLVQLGWDQPISGGPAIGYGFYYLNRPDFYRPDATLRLVVAPVYFDSEVALVQIAPHTNLGIGAAGGGFAYGHTEIRGGSVKGDESFLGHGFSVALSIYRRLNPGRMIPLHAVFRGASAVVAFGRRGGTDPDFTLPRDHLVHSARIGLRFGGRDPDQGKPALELSGWLEGKFRNRETQFGYGDRPLRQDSQFAWLHGYFAYTFPETGRYASLGATLGTSSNADRLNAWRLGGSLPLVSEFPLSLPGYAHQEVTARSFAWTELRLLQPVDRDRRLGVGVWGAMSTADYLPGFEQAGSLNSGVGGWGQYERPSGRWRVAVQYGYGVQAVRKAERGAHSVGMTVQIRLGAPQWPLPFDPRAPSEQPRGGYAPVGGRLLPEIIR
ncbi:MAG: hypothetical protein HY554_12360 [Elusimicrobia bacterium]|nr:hypothetical protein [Elusimicrobiota bacterium]